MSTNGLSREQAAVAERLRKVRSARGFKNPRVAAAKLNLVYSTLKSHENQTRAIREDAAMLYAEAFATPFDWLWTGVGEMGNVPKHTVQPNVALDPKPVATGWRQMPLYGRVYGSTTDGIIIDSDFADKVDCPKSLEDIEGAYALEVIGDSMANRYLPGEIVHVNPMRAYHRGSFVVLQVEAAGCDRCGYIKRFVRRTDDAVIVEQLNPPKEIIFPSDDVKAIHLVVGTAMR